MALTLLAQLQALKADILANTATIPAGQPWSGSFAGTAVNAVPNTGDGNAAVAGWYSQTASPDFNVFRSDVPVDDIWDNVTGANYTPADAITSGNAVQWTACSMACQGKQFNLQLLLAGKSTFNAGKIKQRSTLNDATTNLPSAAGFVSASGGWTNILPVLRRLAKNVEKFFATATTGVGTGTGALGATGNPGLMGYEGSITGDDVQNARNS